MSALPSPERYKGRIWSPVPGLQVLRDNLSQAEQRELCEAVGIGTRGNGPSTAYLYQVACGYRRLDAYRARLLETYLRRKVAETAGTPDGARWRVVTVREMRPEDYPD